MSTSGNVIEMANIIPMAGGGSRFEKAGYKLPKPLIPVSGLPMIINVIRGMPEADKWIFVVRQDHIDNYRIDALIKKEISDAIVVPVSGMTSGQASTCMMAEPYLEKDEEMLISACDNSCLYDKEKYNELKMDKGIDSIVWTFTKHDTLRENPNARGWCILEKDSITIRDMSVKTPVSSDPFNDHAVSSTFFFRHAKDFFDAVNLMVRENFRINNEFYVDAVPIFMKKLGKKSVIFDIEHYLDWGYPETLYDYQRLEYAVKNGINALSGNKLALLKKYFSGLDDR